MIPTRQNLETAVGLSWFFMDGTWMLEWRGICSFFCLLLFGFMGLLAMVICEEEDRTPTTVLVACAETAWVAFNCAWALGDMYKDDHMVYDAKGLFVIGTLFFILAWWTGKGSAIWRQFRVGKFWN